MKQLLRVLDSFISNHSRGSIARRLRVTGVWLIILCLSSGIVMSNIWRLMPEFHYLDTIFIVPLYVQIVLLMIIIILGVFICRKNGRLWLLPVFILMLIFSTASWYQVNISNSRNAFTISLYPFYNKAVTFDAVSTIKIKNHEILLLTASNQTYYIRTGFYPFGLNHKKLNETLNRYGNCVHKGTDGQCAEIAFEWP